MRSFLLRRGPSRPMVVALFAVFLAAGGGNAYAAAVNFLLNTSNTSTAQTLLNGSAVSGKAALKLSDTATAAGSTALALNVASGHAPFTVSSGAGKVANLNADKLDGIDSTGFLGKTAKAADSDMLDGLDSTSFLSATGKAADSDLLDGLDSTDFLRVNGKATDADLLDGRDSGAFIQGAGQAGGQAVAIPAGQNLWLGNPLLGFLRLIYACPANLASNGTFAFNNDSGSLANVFVESGGDNPSYYQMNPGDQVQFPASTTGDSWHIQAQGALGIITIEAASVHRPGSNDCHVQAQAVLTK